MSHPRAAALVLLSASGCVLGPFDLDEITTMQTRTFGGYSQTASRTVRVRALNQATNQWITIGSGVSSATPSIPAGVWAGNPNLYEWTVNTSLTTAADPTGVCFLNPQCTARLGAFGTSTVRLMFEEGSTSSPNRLIVFDEHYSECIGTRTSRGETFDVASYNCRAPSYPELRLRLVEDWSRLPARGPTGEPAFVFGDTGETIVAASDGRSIRYSRKTQSSAWSAWYTIPGAPSAGMRTDSAPAVLIASPPRLFAIGNDGNIYTSLYDPVTHGYGAMTVVPGFSNTSGRVDSSWILNSNSYLVSARVGPNTVQLSVIDGNVVQDSYTFIGTDIAIATNSDIFGHTRYFSVRDGSTISVHLFQYAGLPIIPIGSVDAGAVEDMTEIYGDVYSNTFAVARSTPFGYGEIVAYEFNRLAGQHQNYLFAPTTRVVSSYVLGSQPARIIHEFKNFTWRDATPGLNTARFNGEGSGRFELATAGATGSLVGRPASGFLAAADPKAAGALTGRLVVSLANDQRYRVLSTSSTLGRKLIESYVDIYSTNATSGCGSASNVPDPIWLEDLAASYQPRLEAVRSALEHLPRTTTQNIFRALGARDCSAGAGQPASAHRACELASFPIVLSETNNSYTCSDGYYLDSTDNIFDVEPVLAKQVARGFGFNNNATPPAPWNSAASTIPLDALEEGAAIFSEGLGVGLCNGRCPGFLSNGAGGETSGIEEAFASAFVAYRRHGYRGLANVDYLATNCNDLLARKYNWLLSYVFAGYEYAEVDDTPASGPLPLCP